SGLGSRPQAIEPVLELLQLRAQLAVLFQQPVGLSGNGKGRIELPPVQPDRLGLVNGTDQQANLDGQKLDVGEVDLDVSGNDQPLVQDPIQDVDQPLGSRR